MRMPKTQELNKYLFYSSFLGFKSDVYTGLFKYMRRIEIGYRTHATTYFTSNPKEKSL